MKEKPIPSSETWRTARNLEVRLGMPLSKTDEQEAFRRLLAQLEAIYLLEGSPNNLAYISHGDTPADAAVNFINAFLTNPKKVIESQRRSPNHALASEVLERPCDIPGSTIDPLGDLLPSFGFTVTNIETDHLPMSVIQYFWSHGLNPYSDPRDIRCPQVHSTADAVEFYDMIHRLGVMPYFHMVSSAGRVNYDPRYKVVTKFSHLIPPELHEKRFLIPPEYRVAQHILEMAGYATQADPFVVEPLVKEIISLAEKDSRKAKGLLLEFLEMPSRAILGKVLDLDEYKLKVLLSYYDHAETEMLVEMEGIGQAATYSCRMGHPHCEHLGREYVLKSHLVWSCLDALAHYLRSGERADQIIDALMDVNLDDLPEKALQEVRQRRQTAPTNPATGYFQDVLVAAGLQLYVLAAHISGNEDLSLGSGFFSSVWSTFSPAEFHDYSTYETGNIGKIGKALTQLTGFFGRRLSRDQIMLSASPKDWILAGFTQRMKAAVLTNLAFRDVRENLRATHVFPEHKVTEVYLAGRRFLSPSHAIREMLDRIQEQVEAAQNEVYAAFATDLQKVNVSQHRSLAQFAGKWLTKHAAQSGLTTPQAFYDACWQRYRSR